MKKNGTKCVPRTIIKAGENQSKRYKLAAATTGRFSGRINAICIPRAFIGCPLGKDAGRPMSRRSNCVKGKMNTPPTTSARIADFVVCQVAKAADRNQIRLDTSWPAKPPMNTPRTSRWASLISMEVPFRTQVSSVTFIYIESTKLRANPITSRWKFRPGDLCADCVGGECQRKGVLLRSGGPASRFAHGRIGKSVHGRRPVTPKRFQMIGSAVAFVLRQAILRIELVEFLHAPVAFDFCEDGSGCDGNRSRVAVNQGLLLDGQVNFNCVQQKIIGSGKKPRDSGGHRLAARLVNVPRINAAGIYFSRGPRQRVFVNAFRKLAPALGGQFFRIIEANDPALGIEDHSARHNGTKQGAPPRLIQSSNAQPSALARLALVSCTAETSHRPRSLAYQILRALFHRMRCFRINQRIARFVASGAEFSRDIFLHAVG